MAARPASSTPTFITLSSFKCLKCGSTSLASSFAASTPKGFPTKFNFSKAWSCLRLGTKSSMQVSSKPHWEMWSSRSFGSLCRAVAKAPAPSPSSLLFRRLRTSRSVRWPRPGATSIIWSPSSSTPSSFKSLNDRSCGVAHLARVTMKSTCRRLSPSSSTSRFQSWPTLGNKVSIPASSNPHILKSMLLSFFSLASTCLPSSSAPSRPNLLFRKFKVSRSINLHNAGTKTRKASLSMLQKETSSSFSRVRFGNAPTVNASVPGRPSLLPMKCRCSKVDTCAKPGTTSSRIPMSKSGFVMSNSTSCMSSFRRRPRCLSVSFASAFTPAAPKSLQLRIRISSSMLCFKPSANSSIASAVMLQKDALNSVSLTRNGSAPFVRSLAPSASISLPTMAKRVSCPRCLSPGANAEKPAPSKSQLDRTSSRKSVTWGKTSSARAVAPMVLSSLSCMFKTCNVLNFPKPGASSFIAGGLREHLEMFSSRSRRSNGRELPSQSAVELFSMMGVPRKLRISMLGKCCRLAARSFVISAASQEFKLSFLYLGKTTGFGAACCSVLPSTCGTFLAFFKYFTYLAVCLSHPITRFSKSWRSTSAGARASTAGLAISQFRMSKTRRDTKCIRHVSARTSQPSVPNSLPTRMRR
mmetsp:Transcript_142840/g.252181  ORF Transcript_142840/g.252181 Transcript_142840/m.252181 type:complete len:639 (+) Transcript_142840:122-2038(+)